MARVLASITVHDILNQLLTLPQLVFEVTDACNLQCKYCGYGELYSWYDERNSRRLKLSHVKRLLDYLNGIWNEYPQCSYSPMVDIGFYGGEPLLNMEFIVDLIAYIKTLHLGRKVSYSMTTNALLLSQYMDFLKENDFHLLISLDGDESANSYRVTRRLEPSFHEVCRNIDALREKYPEYYLKNVNFNAVLHNRNSVDGIVDFVQERFLKIPHVSEMNYAGVNPKCGGIFKEMYRSMAKDIQESKIANIAELLFVNDPRVRSVYSILKSYSGNFFDSYIELLQSVNEKDEVFLPTGTCIPFSRKMFVSVNGKILPCEKVNHQFFYGVVTEENLVFDLASVAEQYNMYMNLVMGQCGKCARCGHCSQCIYTLDFDGRKFRCLMKREDAFVKDCMLSVLKFLKENPEVFKLLLASDN